MPVIFFNKFLTLTSTAQPHVTQTFDLTKNRMHPNQILFSLSCLQYNYWPTPRLWHSHRTFLKSSVLNGFRLFDLMLLKSKVMCWFGWWTDHSGPEDCVCMCVCACKCVCICVCVRERTRERESKHNGACVTHDTVQNFFLRPDDTGQEMRTCESSGDLLTRPHSTRCSSRH